MDWEWDSKLHQRIQPGKTGIKKLKDEWLWQPIKLGSAGQYNSHQMGELLEDDVYPCGFCNGTGEKPKSSKCSVCKGKGTVSVEPPAVKCAYCRGRGEEKPRTNVTCTACRGKGVIHVEEPIEICPHCRGTGKEPTNKLVCITCRGRGVVTVREEETATAKAAEKDRDRRGIFANSADISVSSAVVKEKLVRSASGSERDALGVIKELGKSDRVGVARNMSPSVSSAYAEQLCNALVKKGLLAREGLFYGLTPYGEKSLSNVEGG